MKQIKLQNNTLYLKVKQAPLLLQMILFSLTFIPVLFPLGGLVLAIANGSGLKFRYFIGVGFFSWIGFYLLRFSLWNTYGEEKIEILENKIIYEANYGWFKDGKKEIKFDELTYSVKLIGYEEENMGVLVIDSNYGTIELVVKISIPELKELICILETKFNTNN